MYIVHTTRHDRDDLWTPFSSKELATTHASMADGHHNVISSTAYEIVNSEAFDAIHYGDFFLRRVDG